MAGNTLKKGKNDDTAAPVPVRITAATCYSELFPCFLSRHSPIPFICKSVCFIIDTRVRNRKIQTVVPLELLDKMLLSCSNVFFVRPPWRTNKILTFLSSAGLFGGFTPPWCFSWCQTPPRFCTSIWKGPDECSLFLFLMSSMEDKSYFLFFCRLPWKKRGDC